MIRFRTPTVFDSRGGGEKGCGGINERELDKEEWNETANGIITSSSNATDTKYWNVSESELQSREIKNQSRKASSGFSDEDTIRRGWWAVEPELGRVANGIPNRVDRIKCLGNAVVPQVAQVIAQAVQNVEENSRTKVALNLKGA